jgi:hypothetical protein
VVYRLAYMSTSGPWARAELIELLRQARDNNERLRITGVLLHRHAGFLQLLEGERAPVEEVFGRIRADPRHRDVALVWDEAGAERWFADWWMAFRDLEDDPVTEPGLTDVLRGPVGSSRFSHEVMLQLWTALRPGLGPV